MIRATSVIPPGDWQMPPADTVILDYDGRHRRRVAMTGVGGTAFLLDLEKAVAIADGAGLHLEDGRIIAVQAAKEALLEIRCTDQSQLVRIAWHLGNRHLPTEICGATLRIRDDHVIAEMLRGLGVTVNPISAPFHPEGGAYGSAGHHHHD